MEIWKDITGFEGCYQVSNAGRVKSLAKPYRKEDKILKGSPNTVGYTTVQLYYGNKKRKSMLVHRLVMIEFQPNPVIDQLEVNHKDLNIQNNNISNLEWVLPDINKKHYQSSSKFKIVVDSAPKGTEHHLAVMTDKSVIELRRRWDLVKDKRGSRYSLAREFGISESNCRLITNGKTWKHLL